MSKRVVVVVVVVVAAATAASAASAAAAAAVNRRGAQTADHFRAGQKWSKAGLGCLTTARARIFWNTALAFAAERRAQM